jgi:hypothetical protein
VPSLQGFMHPLLQHYNAPGSWYGMAGDGSGGAGDDHMHSDSGMVASGFRLLQGSAAGFRVWPTVDTVCMVTSHARGRSKLWQAHKVSTGNT